MEQTRWSGEQDWAEVSFPVKAGVRTFKCTYFKDGSVSGGSDAAWIDEIVFPVDCNVPEPNGCGKYCGGSGTSEDPFLICNAVQMNTIGTNIDDWNKHFKLTADINLAQYTATMFNIIGTDSNPFTGVFDGNGHTISNFTYKVTKESDIGLFGQVNHSEAQIKNLNLIDPNVDVDVQSDFGGIYVAALVGRMDAGTISKCSVKGGRIIGEQGIAGLVGDNWGTIMQSSASCDVTGYQDVGGLTGRNFGSIFYSFTTGNVSGSFSVGGITGFDSYFFGSTGLISNCYSTSTVTGDYAGGLVGQHAGGTIVNCYSTGPVFGSEAVGGLVGETFPYSTAMNCFWDTMTSGMATSAEGAPKTTIQMQTKSTFTNAGWDFETPVWTILEGQDYPRLAWEPEPPQVVGWQIITMHGTSEIWSDITNGYVEPRTSGVKDLYVCFDTQMDASITEISEIVSIEGVNGGTQSVSGWCEWWDGYCMFISLDEPLPDRDTYTITITSAVKSVSGVPLDESSICITALKGDANASRRVDVSDLVAIRQHDRQPVNSSNARFDINVSGKIDVSDLVASRSAARNDAPSCP